MYLICFLFQTIVLVIIYQIQKINKLHKMSMDAPSRINFFKGHPSNRLLPNNEIIEATVQLLSPKERPYDSQTENRHPLTYGSDEGAYWVRQQICLFNNIEVFHINSSNSSMLSKPEYINLTSGSSYGILNILLQTTLPHNGYTRQAFIITPTYFLINDCFIDAGFGDHGLTAIDECPETNSIDFDLLLKKLDYFESVPLNTNNNNNNNIDCITNQETKLLRGGKKIYRYVMYCVPTFANPSGMTLSNECKLKLIEIARKYDMLIISDDVYDILNYDPHTPIPKRFVHLDRETNNDPASYGNTISNSTFSKIIAPGLRFGYQESINDNLVRQLSKGGANVSGGTPSQLNSMIVGTLLQNGGAKMIINRLISVYSQRGKAFSNAIKKYLPKGTLYKPIKGGYFAWVTLPKGYNSMEIESLLKSKYQVIMANGSNFEVVADKRNWGVRSVRLSISFLEEQEIEEGIRLWGEICRDYAEKHSLVF